MHAADSLKAEGCAIRIPAGRALTLIARAAAFACCFFILSCEKNKGGESAVHVVKLFTGQPAPEFELLDLEGRSVRLRDFRGKTVLVNFWASWCPPCVAEMPALERLNQVLKERGLIILSINVDSEEQVQTVKDFVFQNGITFPVLRDPQLDVARQYGLTGYPETLFIDSEGKLKALKEPDSQKTEVRLLSDRPWDSKAYVTWVTGLLELSGNDTRNH